MPHFKKPRVDLQHMIHPVSRQLPWPLRLLQAGAALALMVNLLHAETLEERLASAISHGELEEIRSILKLGVDPNSLAAEGALSSAIALPKNAETICSALLDYGVSPNATQGGVPVWYGVLRTESTSLLRLLLKRGAVVSNKTVRGSSPIRAASGWPEGVEILLSAGADPDIPAADGTTALLAIANVTEGAAWRSNDFAVTVKKLIAAGADPRRKNRDGQDAADLAWNSQSLEILQLVDLDHRYRERLDELRPLSLNRQLRSAVSRHMYSRVRWSSPPPLPALNLLPQIRELLAKGADPHAPGSAAPNGVTAFELALGAGDRLPAEADPILLDMLLKKTPPPTADRVSAVVLASRWPVALERLVKRGLPLDVWFPEAQLPVERRWFNLPAASPPARLHILHGVAASGAPESLRILVKAGLKVDVRTAEGLSPLHIAIRFRRYDNAEALLALGADPTIQTADGKDASDLAADAFALSLLRKLDRGHRHAGLLAEFPPDPQSPFLGSWITGDEGSGMHVQEMLLRPDGGGQLLGTEIGWRINGDCILIARAPDMRMLMRGGSPAMRVISSAEIGASKQSLLLQMRGSSEGHLTFTRRRKTNTDITADWSAGPSQTEITFARMRVAEHSGFSVSTPEVEALPEELFANYRCESLEIVGTKIRRLPARIGDLECLTRLEARDNGLTDIDPGVGRLTNLTQLSLQRNRLQGIPQDITCLPRLEALFLYENGLTALPEGWERCRRLSNLAIGQNRIEKLPESLGRAPSLKWIQADSNLLSTLPDSFAGSTITVLELAKNRFKQMPRVIFQMPNLTGINLSGNPLAGNLTGIEGAVVLQRLELAAVGLKSFPDLRQLPLRSLNLSDNPLAVWPSGPGLLPSTLEELILRNAGLTEIPDWVSTMALSRLDLFGNPIPEERIRAVEQQVRRQWEDKQRALREKTRR